MINYQASSFKATLFQPRRMGINFMGVREKEYTLKPTHTPSLCLLVNGAAGGIKKFVLSPSSRSPDFQPLSNEGTRRKTRVKMAIKQNENIPKINNRNN